MILIVVGLEEWNILTALWWYFYLETNIGNRGDRMRVISRPEPGHQL